MTPGEAIRENIVRPTLLTYLSVATGCALIVFALVGVIAHSQLATSILLPPSVLHTTTALPSTSVAYADERSASRVQRVDIDATSGAFEPNQIMIDAGRPSQIVFSAGKGCTSRVSFDRPRISADLSQGGALVDLPALEEGIYPFRCSHGNSAGILIAR